MKRVLSILLCGVLLITGCSNNKAVKKVIETEEINNHQGIIFYGDENGYKDLMIKNSFNSLDWTAVKGYDYNSSIDQSYNLKNAKRNDDVITDYLQNIEDYMSDNGVYGISRFYKKRGSDEKYHKINLLSSSDKYLSVYNYNQGVGSDGLKSSNETIKYMDLNNQKTGLTILLREFDKDKKSLSSVKYTGNQSISGTSEDLEFFAMLYKDFVDKCNELGNDRGYVLNTGVVLFSKRLATEKIEVLCNPKTKQAFELKYQRYDSDDDLDSDYSEMYVYQLDKCEKPTSFIGGKSDKESIKSYLNNVEFSEEE